MNGIYPMYIDEMIKSAIDRMTMLEDGEIINFAVITDIHNCTAYADRALHVIDEVNKVYPIDFTFLGGDYLCNNDRTTASFAMNQHKELEVVLDKYTNNYPIFVGLGNHDTNPFGSSINVIHPDDVFDVLMKHHNKQFILNKNNSKSMYGYFDIPETKTRAVFLNVFDPEYKRSSDGVVYKDKDACVISNEQLNWFANEALSTNKDGWEVAVFAHAFPGAVPFENSEIFFGGEALLEVLSAYKEGSAFSSKTKKSEKFYDVECDFTEKGKGSVIGFFVGHYHSEWIWKNRGINIISIPSAASDNFGNGRAYDNNYYLKTRGSGEESSFTIFRVNKTIRKVDIIVCGAGRDFSYMY